MDQMELHPPKRSGGSIGMLTGMRTAEGKMNNRVLIISKIGFPLAFSYMSGAQGDYSRRNRELETRSEEDPAR